MRTGISAAPNLFRVFLLSLLLSVAGCSSDSPTPPRPPEDVSLGAQLDKLVERYGIPGAVGYVHQENTFGIVAAGVRCAGSAGDVSVSDLLHMGSIGKSMTATMIAKLVDNGALWWGGTPADFIPGLADSIHPGYRNITLLDLLRHRAGCPADEDLPALPVFTGTLTEQRVKASRWILKRAPAVSPGTFRYSNAGYVVAGAMAESATGVGWRALMDSLLFEPLAIRAWYGWPQEYDAQEPCGHEPAGAGYRSVDPSVEPEALDFVEPAGFISMRVPDLAMFMQLHIDARRGQPRILSQAAFDTLHAPVGGYACGLAVVPTSDGVLFWHNGSNDYFYAVMHFIPAKNVGVIIAVNAGGDLAGRQSQRATEIVLGGIIQ